MDVGPLENLSVCLICTDTLVLPGGSSEADRNGDGHRYLLVLSRK